MPSLHWLCQPVHCQGSSATSTTGQFLCWEFVCQISGHGHHVVGLFLVSWVSATASSTGYAFLSLRVIGCDSHHCWPVLFVLSLIVTRALAIMDLGFSFCQSVLGLPPLLGWAFLSVAVRASFTTGLGFSLSVMESVSAPPPHPPLPQSDPVASAVLFNPLPPYYNNHCKYQHCLYEIWLVKKENKNDPKHKVCSGYNCLISLWL